MLLALFRARLRALVMTLALTMAAPRVAGWLRNVGERQRRRGRSALAWRPPMGVASALERVSGQRRHTRLRAMRDTTARGLRTAGQRGRQAGARGMAVGQRGLRAGRRTLTRH